MRDECEHGQLRRSCEVCELRDEAEEQSRLIEKQAAEIARLRQRIESAPTCSMRAGVSIFGAKCATPDCAVPVKAFRQKWLNMVDPHAGYPAKPVETVNI